MKKLGICTLTISPEYVWDEKNYETGWIGGSEIWAIKISEEFVNKGYDVYLFGNPRNEHISDSGVKYYKKSYLDENIGNLEFDYFITSRFIFDNLKDVKAKKKILMLHDTQIIGCRTLEDLVYCGIKAVAYESDFQKNCVALKHLIPEEMFFKTIEGVDFELYLDSFEKKNKMVFSSGKLRGLFWFIENVFPKIRKEVPDFEVDITGQISLYPEYIFKQEGINLIGDITRKELVKRQLESKIWIYPTTGYDSAFNRNDETFGLPAIENCAAKNACILGNWGCFDTTLRGYKWFVGKELIDNVFEPMNYDNLDKFADLLALEAIKCLKDEEYRLKIVSDCVEIASKYSWSHALATFETEFNTKNNFEKQEDVKIMLCCIGRLENKYIREFVEFYKAMGVTNICLYDNNRDGEDDFNDVIGDYINNGFVILKNYRNRMPPVQFMAYNECYQVYKNDYDWFLFFDIDEFIFINQDSSLKSYLSRKEFDGFNMIHVNWLNFGDGGNAHYEDKPIFERIKEPIDLNSTTDYDFPDNFHIKSIVRGGLSHMVFNYTPHTPEVEGRCCNATGNECDKKSPFLPYDYRLAGIRHFTTKTAEEFAVKVNRGFCDTNVRKKESLIEQFFKRNEITEEKVKIFKEKCDVDVSYLLPAVFTGKKSEDIKIYTLCYSKKNFQFLNDSVITPLQVGASNGTNVCELKDNTLDNISDKNYFFVECTGTYWIWKNVHGCKYKGQMQYRRPLSGVSETMNFEEIFNNYDVITCKPFNHPENSKPTKEQPMCIPAQTVEEGYGFSNCLDDLLVLEMAIKMYHPEYSDDYDKYIKNGENLYYSNGFILKAEDYDRYAEFMYDCLNHYLEFTSIKSNEDLINHVKYNLEVGKYIRYTQEQARNEIVLKWQCEIGGFLSERLWTLWLQHNFNHDKIYELPYIKMEDNMYT